MDTWSKFERHGCSDGGNWSFASIPSTSYSLFRKAWIVHSLSIIMEMVFRSGLSIQSFCGRIVEGYLFVQLQCIARSLSHCWLFDLIRNSGQRHGFKLVRFDLIGQYTLHEFSHLLLFLGFCFQFSPRKWILESCNNNFRSHAHLALRAIHFQFSQVPSPALSDFCFLMLAETFIMPCRKFHANFQSSTTGRCHSLISFVKSIFAFEKSLLLPFYSYVSCCNKVAGVS
ncbi:hypothetical protein SADUNF_Sadunf16G0122700 [Salix dunnii]|uniref:Uncharacterized protein n=1 Tax=Salix dunnii TaxID=1413687 RepID=A0A835JB98_9ROSI|nr:hypothetical protein SADUNF_Sadunf16G0122700 [Salix dunnii]